ncbi:ribonuclease Z [Spirilliplanes yamanashiensis]|uniref:Ribonuclease Z n=1 Tax=Spirilliplanes yamanashiensis TaxID=42233 RepID=A0A8J4DKR5_9ACTN|nr:ribonuclease Z [Spirilliplanes yamanashiensis]MDP9816060.1 ribonuclease Z [Spirilliplanes yamanashiensis]GIJ04320.1 ribonuclease Z [Spirilliplanes yamanashiensis]
MRELIILGTASQVPTRHRHQNGYVLRWGRDTVLFDPGEGAQRQMLLAGVSATELTRICITHFHGDHCLGLPGVLQRISLDRVPHQVDISYPLGGRKFLKRLRKASSFVDHARIGALPVVDHTAIGLADGQLRARRLRHPIETYGYRYDERPARRMLPDRLAAHGIAGPAVGELQRAGRLGDVTLDDVSVPRPGQSFAFVMDTGLCDAVYDLAAGADMLVIESTFLAEDAALAEQVGHLTAGQAARVAAESGVRTLVLTHFSQRYPDPGRFADEAREHFTGDLVVAEDLMRVPVPPRVLA